MEASKSIIRGVRRGFSLIEILMVVVLVGILLSISVPAVGRQVTRDRVIRSATVVQGMLEEASLSAARRRVPVTVTLASGALRITDRETNEIIRERTFGDDQDLRATLVMSPSGGITIFPNGRGDSNLRIDLSGAGASAVVSRTATGIVRRQ